jgi:hypothetical protein
MNRMLGEGGGVRIGCAKRSVAAWNFAQVRASIGGDGSAGLRRASTPADARFACRNCKSDGARLASAFHTPLR